MTCRMAAGQQKKRLTNSNIPEQYRSKKKPKFDPSDCLVNLKSRIDLKWDDSQNRVVPRKEQVGISWSDMAPFIESTRKHRSGLADVAYVPRETFDLENLRGILSYEVWATCLTEAERHFLTQFLPSGTDAEEKVHLLLTGKNHHFGNPFLSWSTSLCYGNLHPDAILSKEQQARADNKAYYVDLNSYHSNMVEILEKWRERWLSCEDPDNFFRVNPAKQKQGDLQSPAEKMTFPKALKKETPLKVVQNGDVSKFMSYIKISRAQHDLVKSMKQSGDGIQTKHLTTVIGDLNNFHVKPYETLMEDEKRRLHDHWLSISHNDVPAAFEVRRDQKMLLEKLRKSLAQELAEKNVSLVKKAEQVVDTIEELGQQGPHENDDSPDGQEEPVDHSPQYALQGGNDFSPALQNQDVKDPNYTHISIHSHDSLNVEDQDIVNINETNVTTQSQNSSDVQDQDLKDISCTNTSIHRGNSPNKQYEDIKDMSSSHNSPDMQYEHIKEESYTDTTTLDYNSQNIQDEDIKDISYTDTTTHNHNNAEMQAQELKAIIYAGTPIHSHNSPNMQVQDLRDISYTDPPICAHGSSDEHDQDIKNRSCTSTPTGHNMNNIPSANNYPEMNHIIVHQEEAENIAMIQSNSSSLLDKSSEEQVHVDEVMELKDPTAKCVKDIWQSAGPLDSYYHPPENSMYTQSGDVQLKHSHLSGGHQASVIDLESGVIGQQQSQVTVASAFPMDNAAFLLQACSDRQNNGQLQTLAKDIGMVSSYSLENLNSIKQSIDVHSMVNNSLAQSALFPNPLQEQKQLIDQRHNGLYVQQLHKNLYSGARFPTQGSFPVVEQQTFVDRAPVDRSYNWFPEEHHTHSSWSPMESDNSVAQGLPGGSSTDGSLFSVLSQYKQASPHMQFGRSNSSQFLEMRNLVHPSQNLVHRTQSTVPPAQNLVPRTQNTVPPVQNLVPRTQNTVPSASNIYGYTQNQPSNPSNHISSVDLLNNMQWTNFAQQNSGMPDPMNKPFRGPWTR